MTALVAGVADCGLLGSWGADEVLELHGAEVAEDFARAAADWALPRPPWAILAPSTTWGREVAARVAVRMEAGLTGDAIAIDVEEDRLIALKPAFAGRVVVSISATSPTQMATLRPGALPVVAPLGGRAGKLEFTIRPRGRVAVLDGGRDVDLEGLLNSPVVVGVGMGVAPEHYSELHPLLDLLGGALACTRRVADQGWLPRGRQVGLTGLSIRPRLYLALGLSGSFNHTVGVLGAGCVLAVNSDPDAGIFDAADIGIVGDWRQVVPALVEELGKVTGVAGSVTGQRP